MASFGEHLWKSICDFPGRVWDGCCAGWNKLDQGIKQMQQGAGFSGFMTALEGSATMLTGGWFGAGDALGEAVEMSSTKVTDELGNVMYVPKSNTGVFEQLLVGVYGDVMASDENAQTTINEAIKTGDFSDANTTMLFRLGEHALNIGSVAAMAFTGGASVAGLAAKGASVGAKLAQGTATAAKLTSFATKAAAWAPKVGTVVKLGAAVTVGNITNNFLNAKRKELDLESDINHAVADNVDRLMAEGRLSEENKADYEQVLATFYASESVLGAQQVGIATMDMIERAAVGKGLLTDSEGKEAEPDVVSALYNQFMDTYKPAIDSGDITQDQANRLSSLGTLNSLGKLDNETYLMNMYSVQFENYDMTAEQSASLAALNMKRDLGQISEDDYNSVIFTDEMFSDFIKPDGSFEVPRKDDLEAVMLENSRNVSSNTYEDLSVSVSESEPKNIYATQEQIEKNETASFVDSLLAKTCQNLGVDSIADIDKSDLNVFNKSDDADCDFPL